MSPVCVSGTRLVSSAGSVAGGGRAGLDRLLVAFEALSVLSSHVQVTGASPGVSSRVVGPSNTAIGHLSQLIKSWVSDVHAESQATGVPAHWIAAEMTIHESGGPAGSGKMARAYELMQLKRGTLGAATADKINPATNVLYRAKLWH